MLKRIEPHIEGYIKATTAHGGDHYSAYASFFTPINQEWFEIWLASQKGVEGITLFRGYSFNCGYWDDCNIEAGDIIGEDQMTQAVELPAFTPSLIRATLYMNEFGDLNVDNVRVLFEIQTSGKSFVDISRWSYYRSEEEFRCKRNTQVRVESIKSHGSYLHIKCIEL